MDVSFVHVCIPNGLSESAVAFASDIAFPAFSASEGEAFCLSGFSENLVRVAKSNLCVPNIRLMVSHADDISAFLPNPPHPSLQKHAGS